MDSKYDPLYRFLTADAALPLTLSFAQIEQILGFSLPASAQKHSAWWATETKPTHSHSLAWRMAGLRAKPDLLRRRVTFSN